MPSGLRVIYGKVLSRLAMVVGIVFLLVDAIKENQQQKFVKSSKFFSKLLES